MSAFFVWIEKGTAKVDQAVVLSMLQAINGYGGDHADLVCTQDLAIGVQQKWMTSEDVGEKQPFYSKNDQFVFVFDGRIDNRSHLIDELSCDASVCDANLSDGSLLFEFFQRFGSSRLSEVVGPFSFVYIDLFSRRVEAARDVMGGRYLCFYENDERFLLASSELGLMPNPEIGQKLNEAKLASKLVLHTENQPLAFVDGVSVLKPGDYLTWDGQRNSTTSITAFYRLDPLRRRHFKNDQAYVDEFKRLLDQAVQRRLRSRGRIGAMLSGGLDSSPMVASAANQLDDTLLAYSWVFDDFPDEDEREFSVPLCKKHEIEQRFINCDDLWPKFDDSTEINPLAPFSLPYLEYHQATYAVAQQDGVKVLLHGVDGDLLYTAGDQQVIDAFKDSGLAQAIAEFNSYKAELNLSWWSAFKRFVLAKIGVLKKFKERQATSKSVAEDILSDDKLQSINQGPHWLTAQAEKALRPLQYQLVLDSFAGEGSAIARITTNKFGFEKRYPFRDRDLAEFMLTIPTRFLEKQGEKRPILKQAYASELPANILARNEKTRFVKCLEEGIKNDKLARHFFDLEPKYWQEYVKVCYFQRDDVPLSDKRVVKWRCAYYNFWKRVGL